MVGVEGQSGLEAFMRRERGYPTTTVMDKLEQALSSFLGSGELTKCVARVLARACKKARISQSAVEADAGNNAEDVLLVGSEWRLLLPVRSAGGTMEWADRLFMPGPREVYEMPAVVRRMVEGAGETGVWECRSALTRVFREMGDPDWQQMPALVYMLGEGARARRVNALDIKGACEQLGLGARVDLLIAELKAAGVMSPRVGALFELMRARAPEYELNPSLFVGMKEEQ